MMKHHTLVLAVGVVLAVSLSVGAAEQRTINLDDATKQALEKNADIIPAKLDVELAKIDLQSAQADAALSPNPALLRQRRLALQTAEDSYADLQAAVTRTVRNMAFDILKAEEAVALEQRKYDQACNDQATTKLKVDLKIESVVSLLTAEKNVISAQKTLSDATNALEIARMNFLKYIGDEDITQAFSLEIPDFELTLETWDEAKAVEQALSRTSKVVTARNSVEAAELDLKLNDAGFTSPTERRKYEIALEKARLTLATEEKNVRVQVHQYISDINSLHQELNAADIAVQIAQEQLAATQLKHQQGMITDAQLAIQENSLIQAQQSLLDTKFRVRDKQQEFRTYLGV